MKFENIADIGVFRMNITPTAVRRKLEYEQGQCVAKIDNFRMGKCLWMMSQNLKIRLMTKRWQR